MTVQYPEIIVYSQTGANTGKVVRLNYNSMCVKLKVIILGSLATINTQDADTELHKLTRYNDQELS